MTESERNFMNFTRGLLFSVIGASLLRAQTLPPASVPEFEVTSIRRNVSSDPVRVGVQTLPGGRVVALKVTLNNLIQEAYGVKNYQIVGDPGWARSEYYNIDAKMVGDRTVNYQEVGPAIQSLLAERFQLKLHHDTRDVPAYALVRAKNGPKLKPSAPDAVSKTTLPAAQALTRKAMSPKITMTRLALILSSYAGRPVVDMTGIEGNFDVTLEWAADDGVPDARQTCHPCSQPSRNNWVSRWNPTSSHWRYWLSTKQSGHPGTSRHSKARQGIPTVIRSLSWIALLLCCDLYDQTANTTVHSSRLVAVDSDVNLEVLDWGGSGRPLILLTGLGDTAQNKPVLPGHSIVGEGISLNIDYYA